MSRKLICLLLILGLSSVALADGGNFTGALGTDWNLGFNWDTGVVPNITDTAQYTVGFGASNGTAFINFGTAASGKGGNVGKRSGTGSTADPFVNGNGNLTILGNLTVATFTTIGREPGDVGVVNVNGLLGDGTWTLAKNIVVGQKGTGTLNVTNGGVVISTTMDMKVGGHNGTGTVNIDSGSITIADEFYLPGWYVQGTGWEGHGEVYISGTGVIQADILRWGDQAVDNVPTTINGSFMEIADLGRFILNGNKVTMALNAIGDGLIIGAGGVPVFAYFDGTNTIVEIPEPMTIALLGLGGLFLRRRKK